MSDFKERLKEEQVTLGNKLDKLNLFLGSGEHLKISTLQKELLYIQRDAMNTYYTCLTVRLDNLK